MTCWFEFWVANFVLAGSVCFAKSHLNEEC